MSKAPPVQYATLDQLKAREFDLVIPMPGEVDLTIRLSVPGVDEYVRIEIEKNPRPTPPLSKIQEFWRDPEGQVHPVYDDADPAYQQALSAWRERQMDYMAARHLKAPTLSGDTEDERAKAYHDLPTWARENINSALIRLMNAQKDRIRVLPFRPDGA